MGWVDPRPPADPSFVLDPPSTASSGPFKNHLTCTGWLATHLAHHSITVYPYPAVSNDRPGDPVLPKIWSLLTFLMLLMMIMMTKIMRRMMMAIESAQSTKETGQQPAAPDGPHTSPLTHTLAHVSAYTHFYLHLHLHTHLHMYLPSRTFTYTYKHTLAHVSAYKHLHSHLHLHTHLHLYLSIHTFTLTLAHISTVCAAPHVTEPWPSVGDGGLMPLYISLHMAASPSQPGVSMFKSSYLHIPWSLSPPSCY